MWIAAIGLVQSFLGNQAAAEQAHAAEVMARAEEQKRVMLLTGGLVLAGVVGAILLKDHR